MIMETSMNKPGQSPNCCTNTFFFAHVVGGTIVLECAGCGTCWKRMRHGAFTLAHDGPSDESDVDGRRNGSADILDLD